MIINEEQHSVELVVSENTTEQTLLYVYRGAARLLVQDFYVNVA